MFDAQNISQRNLLNTMIISFPNPKLVKNRKFGDLHCRRWCFWILYARWIFQSRSQ